MPDYGFGAPGARGGGMPLILSTQTRAISSKSIATDFFNTIMQMSAAMFQYIHSFETRLTLSTMAMQQGQTAPSGITLTKR